MFKDYYSILGIPANATQEHIKHAYKEQAKKWHPDRNADFDSTERMQDINEAFLILSDIEARRLYDEEYSLFLRTSKQDKESYANEDSYSDFTINDDLLQAWIIKARKQAVDLVKETLSEVKDLSVEGAKASGNKMMQLIIGFVVIGIVFSIIMTLSQKNSKTNTPKYTYPSNNYSASTTISNSKENTHQEQKQEEWVNKSFRDFSFKIPSSLKQRTTNETQILFYPDDRTIALSINIGEISEGYDKNIAIRDLIIDIASFANELTQEKRLNFSDYQLYNYGFTYLGDFEALRVEQYSTQVSGKNIKTKDDTYFVTRNGYFMSLSFVYSEMYKKEVEKIVKSFIFDNSKLSIPEESKSSPSLSESIEWLVKKLNISVINKTQYTGAELPPPARKILYKNYRFHFTDNNLIVNYQVDIHEQYIKNPNTITPYDMQLRFSKDYYLKESKSIKVLIPIKDIDYTFFDKERTFSGECEFSISTKGNKITELNLNSSNKTFSSYFSFSFDCSEDENLGEKLDNALMHIKRIIPEQPKDEDLF